MARIRAPAHLIMAVQGLELEPEQRRTMGGVHGSDFSHSGRLHPHDLGHSCKHENILLAHDITTL